MFSILYAAFLTLFIIGGIYYYENKVRDLQDSIEDYKRAIKISRNNDHYTYLQLENADLKKQVRETYNVNEVLQNQNKKLKKDNQELINGILPQYESNAYKSNTWDSSGYEKLIEL